MKNHNFHAILKEIGDLHDIKNKDYGQDHDPYANVRGSTEWGVEAWKGAMIRANDKIKRLQKFAQTNQLANESVEDSFKDLAVYSLIALDLYRQEIHKNEFDIAPGAINFIDPGDETTIKIRHNSLKKANHGDVKSEEWR